MRRLSDNVHADMHETVLPGLAERVTMIDAPIIGISSTDIVERIQHGKSVRYLLPPGVWDYIAAHRLYGLKT
jgi:nicotinate-nucleotide adenylyltransferase